MRELKNFLDAQGRLIRFPAKRKMQLAALSYLAQKIEPSTVYAERQINDVLSAWHTFGDPATLRRALYDWRFVNRTPDGCAYTKADPQPTFAE